MINIYYNRHIPFDDEVKVFYVPLEDRRYNNDNLRFKNKIHTNEEDLSKM